MSDKLLTINTFKSGPFHFSVGYDSQKLAEPITEARILALTIRDLPIVPDLASTIEEDVIKKSILGTAKIEGNPLEEKDVNRIIDSDDKSQFSERSEKEIANLKEAYDFVKTISFENPPIELSEDLITTLHRLITKEIDYGDNLPGKYRNGRVEVGDHDHGGIYVPPKIIEDISSLMKEFIRWINSDIAKEQDEILRPAMAHFYLGMIHPFWDGNGRTARLLEALMLTWNGHKYAPAMLSNYYYDNVDEYYRAFSLTRKDKQKEITAFFEFYLKGLVSSLNEIKDKISWFINRFALRDYYLSQRKNRQLTERQYSLVLSMFDHDICFSMNEIMQIESLRQLYKGVSERTIRRDMDKLIQLGVLAKEDNTLKINNNLLLER